MNFDSVTMWFIGSNVGTAILVWFVCSSIIRNKVLRQVVERQALEEKSKQWMEWFQNIQGGQK